MGRVLTTIAGMWPPPLVTPQPQHRGATMLVVLLPAGTTAISPTVVMVRASSLIMPKMRLLAESLNSPLTFGLKQCKNVLYLYCTLKSQCLQGSNNYSDSDGCVMIEAFTSVDVGTTCEAHQPTNCELKTYAKTLRTAVSTME